MPAGASYIHEIARLKNLVFPGIKPVRDAAISRDMEMRGIVVVPIRPLKQFGPIRYNLG